MWQSAWCADTEAPGDTRLAREGRSGGRAGDRPAFWLGGDQAGRVKVLEQLREQEVFPGKDVDLPRYTAPHEGAVKPLGAKRGSFSQGPAAEGSRGTQASGTRL